MYSKQKVWAVVIAISVSIFLTTHVQAGKSNNIFNDWQGKFVSREFVDEKPEMAAVFKKVAMEAKKMGKNYTVEQIRNIFKKMMQTDFCSISLNGDAITFYDKAKNMVTHRYKAIGKIPDSYGNHKFEWYAFEAVGKGVAFSPYRYIVMLKIHQHTNGQPHFHFRNSNKGGKALTEEYGMKNWWPTMVKPNFDIAAYAKNANPKLMAKLLP